MRKIVWRQHLIRGCIVTALLGCVLARPAAAGEPSEARREHALQLFSASPAAFIENTGQMDDPSIRYVFNGSGANVFHTTSGPVFQVFRRTQTGSAEAGPDVATDFASLRANRPPNSAEVEAGLEAGADFASLRANRPPDSAEAEAGPDVGADFASLRANRPPDVEAGSAAPNAETRTFSATFPGARQIKPIGRQPLETKVNYYLGADHAKWRTGVPTYAVVVYEGLYEGIDLHTYGRRSNLKYEFHVAPGADWRQIRIHYESGTGFQPVNNYGQDAHATINLSIAENGSLTIDVGEGWGALTDDAPVIYQEIGGRRINLPGRFVLIDRQTYSFEIAAAVDPSAPLVIDPELAWSTYLGGINSDTCGGVALDASRNVVVTGTTRSSGWVSGGFDTSYNGGVTYQGDAYVAKLSPSGAHLWSTYMGGGSSDSGRAVDVDSSGNVLVAGTTYSSGWVSGGFDTSFGGDCDGFAAKLSSSGEHMWSTYIGGPRVAGGSGNTGVAVAVDAYGNVLITGTTACSGWVSGGFDTGFNGEVDGFVAKLSPSGAHLWSTYLGGTDRDFCYGVAVDASGNVVLTGMTASSGWVSGGFDTTYSDSGDVFVAKLSPSGAHLWSTYLGGSGGEQGFGVAADASGNVVVTGDTDSSGWVSGGFDTSHNGDSDAFVAKLSPSGAHIWSTYLGGSAEDSAEDVAVDASGNVVVTGDTDSSGWVSGGFDTSYNGGNADAFVAKLSPSGEHLWSTYLGGSVYEYGTDIAVDTRGYVVATGGTDSSDWAWGGFDTSHNGDRDGFVAKIADSPRLYLTIDSTPVPGIQITGDKPGTTTYDAQCEPGEDVSLCAPATATVAGVRYNFVGWTIDGHPAPAGIALTVTMNTDHTAVAQYQIQTHTLGVRSSPVAAFKVTGDKPGTTNYTATCNDQQSIALTAPAVAKFYGIRYDFLNWTLDGADVPGNTIAITMDGDRAAVAVYTLLGDLNGDCYVDVLDLVLARNRFGQDPASGDNWRADMNRDGRINVLDLIILRNWFYTMCR